MNAIEKFKKDKKHRFFILTGEKGTGKTKLALERAVFLQDNYCISNKDNILVISHDNLSSMLEHIKNEGERDNTVFTLLNSNNLDIFTKKNFFHRCYRNMHGNDRERFCENDIVKGIILDGISKLRLDNFRLNKIIVPQNIDFLYEELLFMKDKNVKSMDEYQVINRKYRGKPIRKNSKVREAIYYLYDWYCSYMKEIGTVDCIDEFNYIWSHSEACDNLKYTHIIIDNCECITVEEIEFLRGLMKKSDYGNFILVRNTKREVLKPWKHYFKNNKEFQRLQSEKFKVISFRKKSIFGNSPNPSGSHQKTEWHNEAETVSIDKAKGCSHEPLVSANSYEETAESNKYGDKDVYMDLYRYVDLKHNVEHDFGVEAGSYNEVILNPRTGGEVIGEDEISRVPVFNEIAAGSPITINDEMEGNFSIPVYWLKGVQQPFILKVKGDSMINAGISDGDYVVINKQSAAENNDIVAVSIDGEATLKRLYINGNRALLKPENDKYNPIEIKGDNVYIIGKAVGLIKHRS